VTLGARGVTEERLQDFFRRWWTTCEKKLPLRRGQLVYAFVPHVGLTPYVLTPEGRTEATEHERASVQIERARVGALARKTSLPVAALPQYPGEVWTVHRAKVRPCLVVAVAGSDVPQALAGSWQTKPAFLVAPAYGSEQTAKRAGWPKPLVERIQACEYPQYLLEQFPRSGDTLGKGPARIWRWQARQGIGSV
jgi:hypothetical protein